MESMLGESEQGLARVSVAYTPQGTTCQARHITTTKQ